MQSSRRQLLIYEEITPFRHHMYDFSATNVDFAGIVTGDLTDNVCPKA